MADPKKQKVFKANVLDPLIERAERGECRLFFMDAAHFVLSAFPCYAWSLERVFLESGAGRNRINVLGAIDGVTKELISINNTDYIKAETVADLLQMIRNQSGDTEVNIVLDNARYQHCSFVMDEAKKRNINLCFLPPPYSPNLNIVERVWKPAKKEVLYGQYFDTVVKFHDAVRGFFDDANQKYKEDLNTLCTLNFQLFG